MWKILSKSPSILVVALLIISVSCRNDNVVQLPSVSTLSIDSVTTTTAQCISSVNSDGGSLVHRGVCWGTESQPTIELETKTNDSTGTGTFTSELVNLQAGRKYYVRAFATNAHGTSYGNELTVVTLTSVPQVTTAVTNVNSTSAIGGGVVVGDGGSPVSARGICWSTNPDPTIALTTKTSDGFGTGDFSMTVSNLIEGTTYYARAYATNSIGTGYGSEVKFLVTKNISEASYPLHIGTVLGGGYVLYVDGSGKHGLIVTIEDVAFGVPWCTGTPVITNATGVDLGTGKTNTAAIVKAQGPGAYAASICQDLDLNGYDDWFLPSQAEFNEVFMNRPNFGPFSYPYYWDSTEINVEDASAFIVTGGGIFHHGKIDVASVRAVREF